MEHGTGYWALSCFCFSSSLMVLVGVFFANEAIFDDLTNEFMLFRRWVIWRQRFGEFLLRDYISEVGSRGLMIKGISHAVRCLRMSWE